MQVFTSTSSNTVGGVRNNGEGKLEDHVIISRGTIETSLLIATRYVLIDVHGPGAGHLKLGTVQLFVLHILQTK